MGLPLLAQGATDRNGQFPMTLKQHLTLLVYSFFTWLTFYLVGLPDYYQSWPFWSKIVLVTAVTAFYVPATQYGLKRFFDDNNHKTNALWLAVYLTLPLFIYDYLLLAIYLDLGIQFVFPYWYLSMFYFSFWIQFPLVARWVTNKEAQQQ